MKQPLRFSYFFMYCLYLLADASPWFTVFHRKIHVWGQSNARVLAAPKAAGRWSLKTSGVFLGHIYGCWTKNRGIPKSMVYFMENLITMDDLGVPLFLETPIYGWPPPLMFWDGEFFPGRKKHPLWNWQLSSLKVISQKSCDLMDLLFFFSSRELPCDWHIMLHLWSLAMFSIDPNQKVLVRRSLPKKARISGWFLV